MYIIIWEYQVKPEKRSEFEEIYASDSRWAELFRKGPGYLGTELLREEDQPLHYLTLDRWSSKEQHDDFLIQWNKEYIILDAQCEGLTERESLLGKWNVVQCRVGRGKLGKIFRQRRLK